MDRDISEEILSQKEDVGNSWTIQNSRDLQDNLVQCLISQLRKLRPRERLGNLRIAELGGILEI